MLRTESVRDSYMIFLNVNVILFYKKYSIPTCIHTQTLKIQNFLYKDRNVYALHIFYFLDGRGPNKHFIIKKFIYIQIIIISF